MRLSKSTILGLILGVVVFFAFVNSVRPVGWFDSVTGMVLAVVVFVLVKKFKGFK